ncbi:MAG: MFS transporter [Bdellovibrionales bacterium]|nr:MFS transporter [Bdellovibrionales bacterium]
MSKITQTYWPYVMMAYAALLGLGFLDNIRGAVFENLIEDLHLTDSYASFFYVVPSTVAFVTSFYSQNFIARFGPVRALRIGLFFMALGFFALSFQQSFEWILVEAAVFGFGFGIVTVAQNVAIGFSASEQYRRQLFSGLHSMYGLSSLLAPLGAGVLFSLNYDWRFILGSSAGLPALVLISSFFLPLKPWILTQQSSSEAQTKNLLKVRRHILFFSLSLSLYLIAEISVSSRIVVYVRRTLALNSEEGTVYLTAFFICLFVSRLFFTFAPLKKLKTTTLLQLSLLSGAFLYTLGLTVSAWFLALSALAMAPVFPSAMDYVSDVFKEQRHIAMAYCTAFASMTVVFMHFSVGILTDLFGLQKALWVGPLSLILVSVLLSLEFKIINKSA